jgi:hypothetical protein
VHSRTRMPLERLCQPTVCNLRRTTNLSLRNFYSLPPSLSSVRGSSPVAKRHCAHRTSPPLRDQSSRCTPVYGYARDTACTKQLSRAFGRFPTVPLHPLSSWLQRRLRETLLVLQNLRVGDLAIPLRLISERPLKCTWETYPDPSRHESQRSTFSAYHRRQYTCKHPPPNQ